MDVKQRLRSVRRYNQRIDSKVEALRRLRSKAEKITTVYSDTPGVGGNTDKVGDILARIMDLENELAREFRELKSALIAAEMMINSLEDPDQQAALDLYYIGGKTWKEVARELNWQERQIYRIHGEALAVLNKTCQ